MLCLSSSFISAAVFGGACLQTEVLALVGVELEVSGGMAVLLLLIALNFRVAPKLFLGA